MVYICFSSVGTGIPDRAENMMELQIHKNKKKHYRAILEENLLKSAKDETALKVYCSYRATTLNIENDGMV